MHPLFNWYIIGKFLSFRNLDSLLVQAKPADITRLVEAIQIDSYSPSEDLLEGPLPQTARIPRTNSKVFDEHEVNEEVSRLFLTLYFSII